MTIRDILSSLFIKGTGIEIGAFHSPWPVGSDAKVLYVDNKDEKTLRDAHPDLPKDIFIKKIDCLDDGALLDTFHDESLDFIIASHFLEHTPSPLTTIQNHIRKIKPLGLAIYAIPNRDNPIDKNRTTVFTFEHLLMDHITDVDLVAHHHEYLAAVDGIEDHSERETIAKLRLSKGFDIHYHCFSGSQWLEMFTSWGNATDLYTIDLFLDAKSETFVVLRKTK